MPKQQSYDYMLKLLIVGDSGVGKSNMLLRFCQDNFRGGHLTTIGIDFKTKNIQLQGKKIKMQIWDTAGQQRFKTITQTYFRGAMGIFLTFAIDDPTSFKSIKGWLKQIRMCANPDVTIILVGNKTDCVRRVSYEQALELAEQIGVQYFQTSAKNNDNIQECVLAMAKQLKDKISRQKQITILSFTGSKLQKDIIQPKNLNNTQKRKCC